MRKLLPPLFHASTVAAIIAALYGALPLWSLAVSAAAWFLLAGPLTVYAVGERPLTNDAFEVLSDGAPTTEGSDAWARSVVADLKRHGFIPRARYRLRSGSLANLFDFAQRLDNDLTGEVAVLLAGWERAPDGPASPKRTVVFHTCFRDGGELVTTNSPLPSLTPTLPGQVAYRIPEVADANALYVIHRRLVKADLRKPKPIVVGSDPLAWEREQNQRAIAVQVAHGLGVRHEKAGVLRLTMKGALRDTWLLHPLFAGYHDRRLRRAVAAALGAATA